MNNNKKILAFIPTYNEKENVEELYNRIVNLCLNIDVLFLDDNSPDGTGEILDELSKKYKNINVIHRPGKLGIGSAHFDGINWAYDNKYSIIITMDCDFTHNPSYIPDMLKKAEDYDVVVASRYILSDSLEEWNLIRKVITLTAHTLTRYLLKMNYDATGAFRLYNLNKIPRDIFNLVSSKDYSFFFESLYILNLNNLLIGEVPVKLPARSAGDSKMTFNDIFQSVRLLAELFLNTLFNRKKYVY